MEKKSVSATLLILFLALTFSIIGICFSVFVYKETKIEVNDIPLVSATGINLYSDEQLSKKVTVLQLSDMEIGLKPATGEVETESQIPSTICDQGTSEGYYATLYVQTESNFKIVVNNIVIESKKDATAVKEERKNIFVSIKDIENATKSLEKDEVEIASFSNVNQVQKLTFYVWLGAFAGEELEGSKINFQLNFILI